MSHQRTSRWRRAPALRALVRETAVAPGDLIAPLFVAESLQAPRPVDSMPGVHQLPVHALPALARTIAEAGVGGVLLFGLPTRKDEQGSAAWETDGVIPRAIRALKEVVPDLPVLTDICLCEYTSHGHCGILSPPAPRGERALSLDETRVALASVALAHARAGADVVAPSAMIDGMVASIRSALDANGHDNLPILSYSAKYASALYAPFRDAAEGAPAFGDRATHQMDPANAREALREHAADIAEGADGLMVKPALFYLDVIRSTRERFPDRPLAAYSVSGEYAMIKAAAQQGWIDERRTVLEALTAMRRAGADLLITYHALDAARWLTR